MPEIIKNEDGTEREVFSADEVTAKLEEAKKAAGEEVRTEFQSKLSEQDARMATFEAEKAELEEKLEELGKKDNSSDKDKNFRVLKEALDKKDKQIDELAKKIEETGNIRVQDFKERLIDKYADGNEDLKKKIAHNFDSTLAGVEAKTEKEIEDKVKNAVKLSVDTGGPSPLDAALQGGEPGASDGLARGRSGDTVEFSANEKKLGAKFGLTDEDYKKYGSRLKNK